MWSPSMPTIQQEISMLRTEVVDERRKNVKCVELYLVYLVSGSKRSKRHPKDGAHRAWRNV